MSPRHHRGDAAAAHFHRVDQRSVNSTLFPEYPVRDVEETIRFHLRPGAKRDLLIGKASTLKLAGLTLICLKNETKASSERDLRELISVVKRACSRRI